MGLQVSASKQVSFDPDRELRLNTSVGANPRSVRFSGVLVYSIFLRLHSKSNGQEHLGDGNPLIFALKGLSGYSITPEEWNKFRPNKLKIIEKILQDKGSFDGIICLPSSKEVVFETACEVNVLLEPNLPIYKDYFLKKSTAQIYDELSVVLNDVPKKHRSKVTTELSNLAKIKNPSLCSFSMKSVDRQVRPYISCLKLAESNELKPAGRYLLVDDLISSGSTLTSAIQCLLEYGIPKENLLGISLLSRI